MYDTSMTNFLFVVDENKSSNGKIETENLFYLMMLFC